MPRRRVSDLSDRSPAGWSPVEAAVAALWEQLLGVQDVGRDDRFLAVGGDSLSGVMLMAGIAEVFGVELPVTAPLDEAQTVPELAALLLRARQHGQPHGRHHDDGDDADGADVLSPAQEGMWFLERLDPASAAHNIPLALRLVGPLDLEALTAAVAQVVDRHEGLRSRFPPGPDGRPRLEVEPPGAAAGFVLPVEDLAGVAPDDVAETARQRVEADARRLMDIAAGPLVRARLLRFAPEDHVLALVVHHIVADGWSRGVIRNELGEFYEAAAAGRLADLPAPGAFSRFARRQRRALDGGAMAASVEYWRQVLTPVPTPFELRPDRLAAAPHDHTDAVRVVVRADDADRLSALARSEDATLFMVLLAGFLAVLHRHSGSEDIVVGVPVAGRSLAHSAGVVGPFVNVLPIRAALDPNSSFVQLLQQVKAQCLAGYQNQAVPLDHLVRELRPERRIGQRPLVQVLFQLRNLPAVVGRSGAVTIEDIDVHAGPSPYELAVEVTEREGGLDVRLEYPSVRFERATIEHLAAHLVTLLAGAVADPHAGIEALPLAGADERATVRAFGSGAEQAAPDCGVHHVIQEVAGADPERVAVESARDGQTLTYGALDRRANQLAHQLLAAGITPGAAVGVGLPREPSLIVALLAIAKAGAAFVPLDLTHPTARLAGIVDDAGLAAVVTSAGLVSSLPSMPPVSLLLDELSADVDARPSTPPGAGAGPHDLAYVLFTSGSTGRPKGVEIEHGGLLAYIDSSRLVIPFRADDRFLAHTSITFDGFLDEVFTPLVLGARIVLADDRLRVDVGGLVRVLQTGRANVFQGTPTMTSLLLDAGWDPGPDDVVVLGGEVMTAPLAARLVPRCRGLWNVYGPTETTDGVTNHRVTMDDVAAGKVPIGRPLPGRRLRVIDAVGADAPVGVPGELVIGGHGVARGYRNRPDLTAAAFVLDDIGHRAYRSGDRCQWRPDGVLDYLGRRDDQVKVLGMRIELGDVEAALASHPDVSAAAAAVRDGRLVAWVAAPAASVDAGDVRRHAAALLPPTMVPSAIAVADLPLAETGKLDRDALPTPVSGAGATRTPPRTATETQLADLWRGVLGLDRQVVREDEFFALGGHSLLVVELVVQVEERFGRSLPLAQLFETPTLAGLAAVIDGEVTASQSGPLVLLRAGEKSKSTLFWVPGLGGTVLQLRGLSERIRPGHRFFGFEAAQQRGLPEPRTIEAMAAEYVEAILVADDGAPFVVGGISFGAMVAIEVTRQLEERGSPPAAAVLYDPALPGVARSRRSRRARKRWLRLKRGLRRRLPSRLRRGPLAEREPIVLVATKVGQRRAGRTYRPGRVSTPVVLFATSAHRREFGDETLHLREIVDGPLELHPLRGTHMGVLGSAGKGFDAVIDAVNALLARLEAQANAGGSGSGSASASNER